MIKNRNLLKIRWLSAKIGYDFIESKEINKDIFKNKDD